MVLRILLPVPGPVTQDGYTSDVDMVQVFVMGFSPGLILSMLRVSCLDMIILNNVVFFAGRVQHTGPEADAVVDHGISTPADVKIELARDMALWIAFSLSLVLSKGKLP